MAAGTVMVAKIDIWTTLDGKEPKWEIAYKGRKLDELTFDELIDLGMKIQSASRFIKEKMR